MKIEHQKYTYIILLGLIFMRPLDIDAKPYFAVRHGYKCNQCHINKTGGGKRNAFGVIYSKTVLPMKKTFFSDAEKKAQLFLNFNNELSEFISLGANLRLDNKFVFKQDNSTTNTFTFPEGNLYIESQFIPDRLSLYFDENYAPGSANAREAFGIWNQLPLNGYIKAGRFILPYGWRLLDDNAFIRNRTGINYDQQDYGVEFGIEPGILSSSLSVTNGTSGQDDDNTNKQITMRHEAVFRNVRFGTSFAMNRSISLKRLMTGVFGGLTYWKITALGEVDYIFDKDISVNPSTTTDQLMLYSQLNYQIWEGLNFQFAYEFLDPDTAVSNDSRIRIVWGVEPYLAPFVQTSVFYRFHDGPPQSPTQSEDEFIVQLHMFF